MVDTFVEYFLGHPKIWFNQKDSTDLHLKINFSHLLGNEINCNLSYILVHDQLTRHIFRGQPQSIQEYDKLALKRCLHCLGTNFDEFSPRDKCFILMPLRHSKDKANIIKSIEIITALRKCNESPFYKRFYQASIKSLIKRNDIVSAGENSRVLSDFQGLCEVYFQKPLDFHKSLIDPKFAETLADFETLVVSVSGGVDSMVLLYHFKNLFPKKNVIATHINYNNRETSQEESDFVVCWCNILNVQIFVRKIDELCRTRESSDREFYESITKQIRFSAYKFFNCPVALGHNEDDMVENIITNISNQTRTSNLKGMSRSSIDCGVRVIRPFLNVSKATLVEFANSYRIPFLQDSTPKWSQRGKIRDAVVPVLNKFDPRFLKGLLNLSSCVTDLHAKTDINSIGNEFTYDQLSNTKWFWKSIVPEASNKSIAVLLDKVNRKSNSVSWRKQRVFVKKNCHVLLDVGKVNVIRSP
jgi:tRNA(Ile)-lysidine synthetase-like protein